MRQSLHRACAKREMLPYKIVNGNKRVVCLASIQYYLHTSYCGLYTMTIDVT